LAYSDFRFLRPSVSFLRIPLFFQLRIPCRPYTLFCILRFFWRSPFYMGSAHRSDLVICSFSPPFGKQPPEWLTGSFPALAKSFRA
jgi:hypothetical protein